MPRDGKPERRCSDEIRQLAAANPLTAGIADFLLHPGFPVDIRHNAKIFREKLAVWANCRRRLDRRSEGSGSPVHPPCCRVRSPNRGSTPPAERRPWWPVVGR